MGTADVSMTMRCNSRMITSFWVVLLRLLTVLLGTSPVVAVAQVSALPVKLQVTGEKTSYPGSFGVEVVVLDDVDGDGRPDFLTGSDGRVFSGSNGSLIRSHGLTDVFRLRGLHDFDADGIRDYVIGHYPGATVFSALTGLPFLTFNLSHGGPIGPDIDSIDDVNGDGIPELVLGYPAGLGGNGVVEVLSGASGSILYAMSGTTFSELVGYFVENLGDLDQNGSPELMVVSGGSLPLLGITFNAAEQIFSVTATGFQLFSSNQDNRRPDRLGDIDGDGIDDYVMSRSMVTSTALPSSATLYSGATRQVLATYNLPGPLPWLDNFAGDVGLAGDVDGDGIKDIAISSRIDASSGFLQPMPIVSIFSGLSGDLLFQVNKGTSNTYAGFRHPAFKGISGGADFDGDGLDDLVVGFGEIGEMVGCVRIYGGVGAFSKVGAGSVNRSGAGGTLDVLRATASSAAPDTGGPARTLVFPIGAPVEVWMAKPPANGSAATPYAIFGHVWEAPVLNSFALPSGIGAMVFAPKPLMPADPLGFTLLDGWGGAPGLLPAPTLQATGLGALVAQLPSLPFPYSIALQGVVHDASAPAPHVSVTNAIRLITR